MKQQQIHGGSAKKTPKVKKEPQDGKDEEARVPAAAMEQEDTDSVSKGIAEFYEVQAILKEYVDGVEKSWRKKKRKLERNMDDSADLINVKESTLKYTQKMRKIIDYTRRNLDRLELRIGDNLRSQYPDLEEAEEEPKERKEEGEKMEEKQIEEKAVKKEQNIDGCDNEDQGDKTLRAEDQSLEGSRNILEYVDSANEEMPQAEENNVPDVDNGDLAPKEKAAAEPENKTNGRDLLILKLFLPLISHLNRFFGAYKHVQYDRGTRERYQF